MLVHVVVDLDVLSLEEVVAIDFHLLARDTRTLLNSSCSIITVSELQALNLFEVLSLGSDSSVEDAFGKSDEVCTIGNEVSLTLYCNHSSEAVNLLYKNAAI